MLIMLIFLMSVNVKLLSLPVEDFFISPIEGSLCCSLAHVLIFASGADHIPLLGYENSPTLEFVHNETKVLPTASTCDVQLRLPTTHGNNYQKFKEMMMMAILGHDGFGGI